MGVQLLDRVRETIRTRHHYSRRTEDAYVYWIRRYIVFHNDGSENTIDFSQWFEGPMFEPQFVNLQPAAVGAISRRRG